MLCSAGHEHGIVSYPHCTIIYSYVWLPQPISLSGNICGRLCMDPPVIPLEMKRGSFVSFIATVIDNVNIVDAAPHGLIDTLQSLLEYSVHFGENSNTWQFRLY